MSAAHVCDECMTVAPIDQALGWWHVEAMNTLVGQLLSPAEKPEYQFCSWACLQATAARLARSGVPA